MKQLARFLPLLALGLLLAGAQPAVAQKAVPEVGPEVAQHTATQVDWRGDRRYRRGPPDWRHRGPPRRHWAPPPPRYYRPPPPRYYRPPVYYAPPPPRYYRPPPPGVGLYFRF